MRKPASTKILDEKNKKVKETKVKPGVPQESIPAIDQIPPDSFSVGEEGYLEVIQTVIGKQSKEAKIIKVRPFITTPASVSVHAKRHVPLGPNDGNITVAVTLQIPCYKEEIIPVYKQADELVDKIMEIKFKKMGINADG
jgi:hypothetical protein